MEEIPTLPAGEIFSFCSVSFLRMTSHQTGMHVSVRSQPRRAGEREETERVSGPGFIETDRCGHFQGSTRVRCVRLRASSLRVVFFVSRTRASAVAPLSVMGLSAFEYAVR